MGSPHFNAVTPTTANHPDDVMIETGNTLCDTCLSVFCRDLSDFRPASSEDESSLEDISFPHHWEVGDFQKAAQEKCQVCLRNWRHSDGNSGMISKLLSQTETTTFEMEYIIHSGDFRNKADGSYSKPPFWLEMNWCLNEIRFYTFYALVERTDPQLSQHPEITTIEPTTSSEATFTVAREWVEQCIHGHEKCDKGTSEHNFVPNRLIDIGGPDQSTWKLTVTPSSTRYISLSYRWGHGQSLKLTSSTSASFSAGLPISKLPKLFRDVVSVARCFSVQYLWIDALCIQQDSKEDWQRESRRMRDVYANSYLTVAATACPDPNHSLFRTRKLEDIRSGLVQTQWASPDHPEPYTLAILERDAWDRQRMQSTLSDRGWALQERLLAPRVLHFAKYQLLWECDTVRLCEAFPQGAPSFYVEPFRQPERLLAWLPSRDLNRKKVNSIELFSAWKRLVELYSRCTLTKPSDKLVAFTGITDLFQEISQDTCIAGLWRPKFMDNLCWFALRNEGTVTTPAEYRAPSWSWASVDGPIFIPPVSESRDYRYPTALLDVKVETGENNLAEGSYIALRGPAIRRPYCELDAWPGTAHRQQSSSKDFKVAQNFDDPRHSFKPASILFLLPLRISSFCTPEQHEDYPSDQLILLEGIILEQHQNERDGFLRRGSFSADGWSRQDLNLFGLRLNHVDELSIDEDVEPYTFKVF